MDMAWRIAHEVPPRTYGNVCGVCHAARTGDIYLDGDIEIDGDCTVICRLCFEEGARLIGWIPASDRQVVEVPVQHDSDIWFAEWERVEATQMQLLDAICIHTEATE